MTTVQRVKSRYIEPVKTGFRFRDLSVVILCLFIFAYSLNLFWNDLFNTINLQNVDPVGTITIRNNTVQRRLSDRVIWDRLILESPVYLGDLIRVAEMSSATLNIGGSQLDIGENTLIRIQPSADGEGVQIELSSGSVGITVTEESVNQGFRPLSLNMNGRIIETTAGTSITASASDEGTAIQVNEGSVIFTDGDTIIEMAEGEKMAQDSEGTQITLPSLVVMQPHFNANYEKSAMQGVNVSFAWNRLHFKDDDTIRLEIAADRNFSRDLSVYNNLDSSRVSLEKIMDAGNWNWRFIYEGEVMASGRFTVIEKEEPVIIQRTEPVIVAQEPAPPETIVQETPLPPPPAVLPPLSVPLNRMPASGHVFGIEQIRSARNIVFSWSGVQGANAYIVTIFRQSDAGRRQINREIVTGTNWTLSDLSILERGAFVWQVEAIYRNTYGSIERRGRQGDNYFTMDVPAPRPVQKNDPGVLYGQ
ncbi:MAG: FecR family protein [Treponema sp.]|nr:FecR family protein [Treponema sp.]MCL2237410.1 FecR family protein [Treponema sp.]